MNNKKTSIWSPIVGDSSYASKVDDDCEVTLLSRSVTRENSSAEGIPVKGKGTDKTTLSKQSSDQNVKISTEGKGGSKTYYLKQYLKS